MTATSEQAQEVHGFIRSLLKGRFGEHFAEEVFILYGGSMNPKVTRDLLEMLNIDGGLVGGASLEGKVLHR